MSELFDSLRRGGRSKASSPARPSSRLNRGEAILASLGYKPVRRTKPAAVSAIAVLAIAAAGFYAWSMWPSPAASPAPPTATARAVPPPASRAKQTERAPADPVIDTPVPPLPAVAPVPAPKPLPPPAPEKPVATTETATSRPPLRRASRPDPVATESEAFALAVYHQRAGDFENALLSYRAVLEKNELNARARNNLGLLYLDKGLLDDAVRELKRALIIDPRYLIARVNLGVALMRQNKPGDAASEFSAVLSQDGQNVDALVNLALVEQSSGNLERAKELLLQAVGVSPRSAWAHYNLAVVFDHSGEVARAVEHYRSFLDNAGPEVSARAPDVRARLDALTRR